MGLGGTTKTRFRRLLHRSNFLLPRHHLLGPTMKTRTFFGVSLSLIIINMAAIMERADENLLPSVYKEVSEAFNAGPSDLGYLTFIRNFVQGLASPMAGVLVITYDRPVVLAMGTVCWALSTAAVAGSQYFRQVAFWRAVNGLGLAIVIPALQSFIADSYKEASRGTGFGFLNVVGTIGGIGGGVLATVMAGYQFWGVPGWRCAFILMATLSSVIGFLVYLFVVDPRKISINHAIGESYERDDLLDKVNVNSASVWLESWTAMKAVIRVKTFQIIVLQGLVGSLPWTAMVFLTMWFELIGEHVCQVFPAFRILHFWFLVIFVSLFELLVSAVSSRQKLSHGFLAEIRVPCCI